MESIANLSSTGTSSGNVIKKYALNKTDTIIDSSIENVTGTQDNDTITGNAEANTLIGEAGNDTLRGLVGQDTLDGGLGNDTLEGGLDDDEIRGGAGTDTASYENASGSVIVDLEDGTGKGISSGADGNDTLLDIENVRGSAHDDTITGDDGKNTLHGLDGDDYFYLTSNSDVIDGGNHTQVDDTQGSATVKDGAGDTVDASLTGVSHTINLKNGQISGNGSSTVSGIENVIGSNLKDNIQGDDGKNTLKGEAGEDTIWGEGGDDFLYGGSQDDTLRGGLGDDYIDGGAGSIGDTGDFADYFDITAGGVKVDLTYPKWYNMARYR